MDLRMRYENSTFNSFLKEEARGVILMSEIKSEKIDVKKFKQQKFNDAKIIHGSWAWLT